MIPATLLFVALGATNKMLSIFLVSEILELFQNILHAKHDHMFDAIINVEQRSNSNNPGCKYTDLSSEHVSLPAACANVCLYYYSCTSDTWLLKSSFYFLTGHGYFQVSISLDVLNESMNLQRDMSNQLRTLWILGHRLFLHIRTWAVLYNSDHRNSFQFPVVACLHLAG